MSDAVLTNMVFQLREDVLRLQAEVAELEADRTRTLEAIVALELEIRDATEGRVLADVLRDAMEGK